MPEAPEQNLPGSGLQTKMQDQAHLTVQHVHVSDRTLAVVAFGFSIAAFVWGLSLTREVDRLVRETHVNTVTTENHDALLIREGLKQPADWPRGPTGNIDYQPQRKRFMGGQACELTVRAVLTFDKVPTEASDLQIFDRQIRDVYSNSEYADSVVNLPVMPNPTKQIVNILRTPSAKWTSADRQLLMDTVDQVCGTYS